MEEKFIPGRLVCSTAGRDRGEFYLVLRLLSPNMVQVVNGEERTILAPKKKNVKHLRPYPQLAGEVAEKISAGQKITDLEIKKALEGLLAGVQARV